MPFPPRRRTRRAVLALAAVLSLAAGTVTRAGAQAPAASPPGDAASGAPAAGGTTITLLGVGPGPMVSRERNGIATLLTAGGRHYLVDAGIGATRQLAAAGLEPTDVSAVLLTHLHDDHTADLPALLSFRATAGLFPGAPPRLRLLGPPGVAAYAAAAGRLIGVSGAIRQAEARAEGPGAGAQNRGGSNRGRSSQGGARAGTDGLEVVTLRPGAAYDDGTIRVTAVENTHYSGRGVRRPAGAVSLSLRIEAGGRAITFTGDTGPSRDVERLARGSDVLVAEMVSDDDSDLPPGFTPAQAQRGHLSPRRVGELAAAAGVGMVVLSHYTRATEADLRSIAAVFPGRVVAGRDLMRF
ncbi:MBL fold metallo-hydrolase [Pararoseomonas sp. SCSIO 73927]|uniref:MBL fold metallo-hydrolase n=1 Tax=Pararoseomonas sp. SCSIO 73927 TaxID=3114537 RepID=UPI0030D4FF27